MPELGENVIVTVRKQKRGVTVEESYRGVLHMIVQHRTGDRLKVRVPQPDGSNRNAVRLIDDEFLSLAERVAREAEDDDLAADVAALRADMEADGWLR